MSDSEDWPAEQSASGELYKVFPYVVQKRRHPGVRPRGVCRVCEVNYTLRADNRMREHTIRPYVRCEGSSQLSLGLPLYLRVLTAHVPRETSGGDDASAS